MSSPLVTFLVPTYNYGRFLRECADSILAQTFTDFELIILDDASTDNTPDIAQQLMARDVRIHYVQHPENVGHLANYNKGIQQAKGDYIWLISADDKLANTSILQTFVDKFEANPSLGFCFSRVQCINNDSVSYEKFIPNPQTIPITDQSAVISGRKLFEKLLAGNFVPAPGAIARKTCYERYGLFHPALTHSGDWYNWLAFSLDYDVYYHAESGVYYRKHPNNMHHTYANPQHALDNSLLCLETLEVFLCSEGYADYLIQLVEMAQRRFKAKNNYPMSFGERCQTTLEKAKEKLHLK